MIDILKLFVDYSQIVVYIFQLEMSYFFILEFTGLVKMDRRRGVAAQRLRVSKTVVCSIPTLCIV